MIYQQRTEIPDEDIVSVSINDQDIKDILLQVAKYPAKTPESEDLDTELSSFSLSEASLDAESNKHAKFTFQTGFSKNLSFGFNLSLNNSVKCLLYSSRSSISPESL